MTELKSKPESYGLTQEQADKINPGVMAKEMASTLYGDNENPGAIETVLGIPRSKDMIDNIRVNNALSFTDSNGEIITFDGRDLANGTWLNDPARWLMPVSWLSSTLLLQIPLIS